MKARSIPICFVWSTERTRSGLSQGMDKDWFDEKRSRVHKALRDKPGKTIAEKYYIVSSGARGDTRYNVAVENKNICWNY